MNIVSYSYIQCLQSPVVESYLHFSVLYPMFILPDYPMHYYILDLPGYNLVIPAILLVKLFMTSSYNMPHYIYIYTQQIWECTMKYHKCFDVPGIF